MSPQREKVSVDRVGRVRGRLDAARVDLQRHLKPDADLDGVLDTIRELELLLHPAPPVARDAPIVVAKKASRARRRDRLRSARRT